eukprot:g41198.t1
MQPEEVGEVLNEYVVLVFTKEKKLVKDDLREGNVEFLSQVAIKKEEMLCVLKSIKIDRSLNSDGIYPRILRKEVVKMIDEEKVNDAVYVDFSKVFDRVPHGRLVQKVNSHGI